MNYYFTQTQLCQRKELQFVLDLCQISVIAFFHILLIRMLNFSGKYHRRSLAIMLLIGGVVSQSQSQTNRRDIRDLARWMTGSFDTFAQVDADEEADAKYRHIRALMHLTPVTISGLNKGFAFYVENQAAETRTKPYRQRVYYLSDVGGKISLQVFRIRDDENFINAQKDISKLRSLTFDRLTKEEGCDLTYVRVDKNTFKGSNFGNKACKSSLRGATHTNSESEISAGRWVNLDQGFDDDGNHKWGPPPGTIGHVFIKRK